MPVHKPRLVAAAVLGLLAALALIGWFSRPSPPRYTVTDLGVLPGDTFSTASGVNNRGEVVGVSAFMYGRMYRPRTFLYVGGVMTDLGPNAAINGGLAINDRGQVSGETGRPGLSGRAYLYDHGQKHDLGTLPGFRGGIGSAINSQGQVVGEAQGGQEGDRAFLYAGRMINLGVLPGYQRSAATAVNTSGQIVGVCADAYFPTQAFIYDVRAQKMTALPLPPGLTDSQAFGLNDHGEVIGIASASAHVQHVLLWQGKRVRDLGTPPGTHSATGTAINNRGEAVITAWTSPNAFSQLIGDHPIRLRLLLPLGSLQKTQQAYVWRQGRMTDLNTLIPVRSGWVLAEAQGINDRGQIVGRGLHHGQERAFLLTPIH